MKHIYAFIILVSMSPFVRAQITWDIAIPDTVYSFETNPDVEVHNNVTFTDSGTYRWVREVITSCPITNAICDKTQCYLEHVDSADFFVEANETFPMLCHFYPYDNCCKYATCILTVYKVADPSVNTVAEYNISLWCSALSAKDVEAFGSDIKIYPIPAKDYLQIETESIGVSDIIIYDVQGRMVKQAEVNQLQRLYIGDLPAGTFYITSTLNGVLSRKRFVKI